MTTSYQREAVKALRAQKKLDREAEAEALSVERQAKAKKHTDNVARISAKEARIAGLEPVAEKSEPSKEAEASEESAPVSKKKAATKKATKKQPKKVSS